MSAQRHYMYVLECADGTLYTGYTIDLEQRLRAHNSGKGAKYTARRRPVRLIAQATFSTKHDAMRAEFHFKRLSRAQKLALITAVNPARPLETLLTNHFASR